jgi:hypothetical protein
MLKFRDLDVEVMGEIQVAWLLSVFEVREEQ